MRHFFRGVKITPSDLERRLLVIPINGVSTLYPGGELPLYTYCFIDNSPTPTVIGTNIDLVFVAYDGKEKET